MELNKSKEAKIVTILYFEDIGIYLDDKLISHISENDMDEFPEVLIGLLTEGITEVNEISVEELGNPDAFWDYVLKDSRWRLPNSLVEVKKLLGNNLKHN